MVAVALMWSIAGVVTRHLERAASLEITFWRSFFTAVSLLIILPLWRGAGAFARVPWASRYFWVSGLCWSVMFTAFMVALTLTRVANVLVIMALGPLFSALAARVGLHHRIPRGTGVAVVVAGLGVAGMYGAEFLRASASGTDWRAFAGSLIALGVPLAAAVQWTVTQAAQRHGEQVDLVPSVLLGALISSAVTLPFATPFVATGHDVALLALLGLVQLAIPCVLAVLCARVLKAPEVALLALLEIIFGILLAWLGAGEQPGAGVLAGGVLVIGALVVNEWLGWRRSN